MLRITRSRPNGSPPTVKLEGKLLQPWIAEVRSLFVPPAGGNEHRLDLSDLTFVDRAGALLLRQLRQDGVVIESCSSFVAELLNGDCESTR
jgi:hypothetical protein